VVTATESNLGLRLPVVSVLYKRENYTSAVKTTARQFARNICYMDFDSDIC